MQVIGALRIFLMVMRSKLSRDLVSGAPQVGSSGRAKISNAFFVVEPSKIIILFINCRKFYTQKEDIILLYIGHHRVSILT